MSGKDTYNVGDKIAIKGHEWIITYANNYRGYTNDVICYRMVDGEKKELVASYHYFDKATQTC